MDYTDMLLEDENPFIGDDRKELYHWLTETSRIIYRNPNPDKSALWEDFITEVVMNGNQHEFIIGLTEYGHSRLVKNAVFRYLKTDDIDSINFVNAAISSHRWRLKAKVNNPPGTLSSIHTVNAHTYASLMKKSDLPASVLFNALQSVNNIADIYVFLTEAKQALTFNNLFYVYEKMPQRLLKRSIWVKYGEALPEGIDEYFMTIGEILTLIASKRETSLPLSWVEKMFTSLKTVAS